MNIVIEGCDGSGKSTIARFLCEKLGMYYWHESSPRSKTEYEQMLAPGGVVFDRFCLGQFIYNKKEDRKLTREELKDLLHSTFKQTNTLLIYVNCATSIILKRLLERGECPKDSVPEVERWIKNIRGGYRQLLQEMEADYLEINGENGLCISIK